MNWAKNAYNKGYKFDSIHNSYQKTLAYYEKNYNLGYIRPMRKKHF